MQKEFTVIKEGNGNFFLKIHLNDTSCTIQNTVDFYDVQ